MVRAPDADGLFPGAAGGVLLSCFTRFGDAFCWKHYQGFGDLKVNAEIRRRHLLHCFLGLRVLLCFWDENCEFGEPSWALQINPLFVGGRFFFPLSISGRYYKHLKCWMFISITKPAVKFNSQNCHSISWAVKVIGQWPPLLLSDHCPAPHCLGHSSAMVNKSFILSLTSCWSDMRALGVTSQQDSLGLREKEFT